jgi:hypothetical protein
MKIVVDGVQGLYILGLLDRFTTIYAYHFEVTLLVPRP